MNEIEVEQEADGRWIAEVVGLRGVLVYGKDESEARSRAEALARQVRSDLISDGK